VAQPYPPLPEALIAITSDEHVTVEHKKAPWALFHSYYVFTPKQMKPAAGFIFYPGGLVDPRSYAPPLHEIAAQGYLAILVSMPFYLAPFGWQRARHILQHYHSIEKWAMGGHSVGGAYACKYAKDFTRKVEGVVIRASFPSEKFRLDHKDLEVVCIYASNNPNCNADEIDANKLFLPADTVYVEIAGGNHTRFGYYDTSPDPVQSGDGIAGISREEQQAQIIQATPDRFHASQAPLCKRGQEACIEKE
jgi:hypothetical protein